MASLRGNLKLQTEANASARNQQKIKKKLAEQENELTLQSSHLKLIVRANPSLSPGSASLPFVSSNISLSLSHFSSTNNPLSSISTSMTNLTNLNHFPGGGGGGGGGVTNSSNRSNFTSVNTLNSATALSGAGGSGVGGGNATLSLGSPVISNLLQSSASSSNSQACTFSPVHPLSSYSASVYTFVFLFTSDFERNAWLEELNGAIYACKSKTLKSNFNSTILISSKVFFIFVKILDKARKNTIYIQQSDIEARINSLKVIHFFRALHLR